MFVFFIAWLTPLVAVLADVVGSLSG